MGARRVIIAARTEGFGECAFKARELSLRGGRRVGRAGRGGGDGEGRT